MKFAKELEDELVSNFNGRSPALEKYLTTSRFRSGE
jgi:hypothetical protein